MTSGARRRARTPEETTRRDDVVAALRDAIREGRKIALPPFDGSPREAGAEFALQTVGAEPNPYSGTVGDHRYQFEGEDDLLHLMVVRLDGGTFPAEEAQAVAAFVLPDLPPSLLWLKPGDRSHHFYFGHDELMP